jgi:predicted DsbA family dithiol-disulfide isomerase
MEKRVINLNAFGEIIVPKEKEQEIFINQDRSEERPFRKVKEESYPYETVFKNILENIVQTKLLHWQTYKYSQHKALDKLFDSLIDLGDELADVLFVLICLANQTGVDLEKALKRNLEKKTSRDSQRHKENEKLK